MHLGTGRHGSYGPQAAYEFGRFRLDPDQNILWRDGQVLPLGPKVVQTLSVLVANFGQVISRQELIRLVWSDTAVEDSNLAHNISVLRRSLREDPSCRFTIETVPRRGYRFCEVRPAVAEIPVAGFAPRTGDCSRSAAAAARILSEAPARNHLGAGIVVAGGSCRHWPDRSAGSQTKLRSRRSVAVVGFANLSQGGDSGWLAPALSEMMTTELGAGGKVANHPGRECGPRANRPQAGGSRRLLALRPSVAFGET